MVSRPVRLVVQGVQQIIQHIGPGGLADGILVDLVGHNQAGDIGADGGAEPVIVLPDCRPFVGAGDAQVQLSIGTGADAAQPGGEAVGHPPAAVKASAVWKTTPFRVCWVNDIDEPF